MKQIGLSKRETTLLLSALATWQSDYEGTPDFKEVARPISKLQDKLEKHINLK